MSPLEKENDTEHFPGPNGETSASGDLMSVLKGAGGSELGHQMGGRAWDILQPTTCTRQVSSCWDEAMVCFS